MDELVRILKELNIQVGCVESFTLGNFAAKLGSIPGVSQVFKGGLITYQTAIKERLLGISHEIIEKKGVVSKEIASLMAVNGKALLNCDICVSFTGNAGPDVMEGKPVGLVYIGVAYKDIFVYELKLQGTRLEIQEQAIDFIVRKLMTIVKVN